MSKKRLTADMVIPESALGVDTGAECRYIGVRLRASVEGPIFDRYQFAGDKVSKLPGVKLRPFYINRPSVWPALRLVRQAVLDAEVADLDDET